MAVIKFAAGKNNTYAGMKKAIDYILNEKKTDILLTYGKDCCPDTAYHEFIQTKIDFHKEDGRQFKHLIQSFAGYETISPEQAHQVGIELLNCKLFDGFQVVMATHKDKNHLHNHFIINSINTQTGKKWDQSKEQLYELREYNDHQCRKHNLVIIPDSRRGKSVTDGEYRNTVKGTSWKHELWLAVNECMKCSTSRKDFIANMNCLGYQVNWKDERKYITFTTPDGKKCRNNKLYPPENYTKEKLEKTFELNCRYQSPDLLKENMELLKQAVFLLGNIDQYDIKQKNYPLSQMEGQALREYIKELEKGDGIRFEYNNGVEH